MSKLEEWMQKLMWYVEEMRGEWINVCRPQFQQFNHLEMVLISKHYPLIKRLVDNDKIKLWAYDVEWYHFNIHTYLDLIMLLAIQDEPIEFLLSIIK